MKIGYIKDMKKYPSEKQLELLLTLECDEIHNHSKISTQELLHQLQVNDTLCIARLSIIANSTKELYQFLLELQAKEVNLDVVEQETPFLDTLISFLELILTFQKDLQYQRQAVGIQSAIKRGVRFGRPTKMKQANVIKAIRFKNNGYTSKEVANRFNVGKSTLLRYIAEYKKSA